MVDRLYNAAQGDIRVEGPRKKDEAIYWPRVVVALFFHKASCVSAQDSFRRRCNPTDQRAYQVARKSLRSLLPMNTPSEMAIF